jgi:hypothetical protein
MNPSQLVNSTKTRQSEHAHQAAYFCWISNIAPHPTPNHPNHDHLTLSNLAHLAHLSRAFAIPNGGQRDPVSGSRLKAEGVRPGVPDVFVPIPIYNPPLHHPFPTKPFATLHGLWLEFKRPTTDQQNCGQLSKHQIEYQKFLTSQGYAYRVVYSWHEAALATLEYLQINLTPNHPHYPHP